MLRAGDPIQDLAFLRPDGGEVRLAAFDAAALVMVFLRHLA
jgi:hypothetical protein